MAKKLDEARALARALLHAFMELADSRDDLEHANPELEWEKLPEWLTDEPWAPETWQRGRGE